MHHTIFAVLHNKKNRNVDTGLGWCYLASIKKQMIHFIICKRQLSWESLIIHSIENKAAYNQ